MKKIRLILVAALMAGLFITNGCVDNEESDSVKQLRQAQIALIQARTVATQVTAEADAAYTMARAAYETARATREEAQAAMQVIQNAMAEAENEFEMALLEMELAVLMAEQEMKIAEAAAEAEAALANAEAALLTALRNLEKAILEDGKEMAQYYLSKYQAAMTAVLSKRSSINSMMASLETAMLYVNAPTNTKLVTMHEAEKEWLEYHHALLTDYKEKYELAIGDLSALEEMIVDAMADSVEIKKDWDALTSQIEEAEAVTTNALADHTAAVTAFDDLKDDIDDLEDEIDEWTNSASTSSIGTINRNNEGLDINDVYWSRKFYEDGLEAIADLVAAAEARENPADELDPSPEQAELEAAADAYNLHFFNHFAERDIAADWHVTSPSAPAPFNGSSDYEEVLEKDWDALEAVVVAEWTIVGDYITEILEPELADLELAYEPALADIQEAYDAWVAAKAIEDDLKAEKVLLTTEYNLNNLYLENLKDDYEALEEGHQEIVDILIELEGEIAGLDNAFASWENYIAYLEAQLEFAELELVALEEEADYWKTMLDGELGDE